MIGEKLDTRGMSLFEESYDEPILNSERKSIFE
jgi:hypothetical protein